MAKSLSERIAERAAKKKPSRNAQNRAAFLAIRGDVTQALNDGWPVKTIWQTLHEESKITFSYQAFRGYVNRLILANHPSVEASHQVSKAKSTKPAPITGFHFEPEPNKKDLL